MRFFICDATSDNRECYWNDGLHMSSIWGPSTKNPPPEVSRGDAFVVGIEIFKNRGDPPPRPANRHAKLKHLDHGKRDGERPPLRPKIPIVPRYMMRSAKSTASLRGRDLHQTEPDCVLLGHKGKSTSLGSLSHIPSRPLSPIHLDSPKPMQTKPFPADYSLDEVAAWALKRGPGSISAASRNSRLSAFEDSDGHSPIRKASNIDELHGKDSDPGNDGD